MGWWRQSAGDKLSLEQSARVFVDMIFVVHDICISNIRVKLSNWKDISGGGSGQVRTVATTGKFRSYVLSSTEKKKEQLPAWLAEQSSTSRTRRSDVKRTEL